MGGRPGSWGGSPLPGLADFIMIYGKNLEAAAPVFDNLRELFPAEAPSGNTRAVMQNDLVYAFTTDAARP